MMHLDQQTLQLLLGGRLSDAERQKVADHIIDCPRCARDFRMFRELRDAMPAEPAAAPVVARTPKKIKTARLRLATIAALAVAAMGLSLWRQQEPTDTLLPEMDHHTATAEFNILENVRELNYRSSIETWGRHSNVLDLVAIQNQKAQ